MDRPVADTPRTDTAETDTPKTDLGIRNLEAVLDLVLTSGSLSRASRLFGRHRNYFRRVRERGSIPWRAYYQVLEHYGVSDRQLSRWARSVAGEPALESFGAEAFSLALRHEPAALKQIRLAYLQGQLANDETVVLPNVLLGEVDDLRYSDPAAAEKQARAFVRQAHTARDAARALAVWGSALKYCNKLDQAQLALWTGMRIAACEGLTEPLGDLIQRAAYVVSDRGDFMRAYDLACCAHLAFEAHGHQDRIGQTLVTQGIMLHRAGETEREVAPFERALEVLDPSEKRGRFTALQVLSANAAGRGDLRQADDLAARAQDCVPGNDLYRARLFWLRARLASAEDRLVAAGDLYRQAAEALSDQRPIEAAMVAAEHVRLLARQHQFEAGRRLANAMHWVVLPLQDEVPAAAAAFVELIVAADQAKPFAAHAWRLAHRVEQAILQKVGDHCLARPRTSST